MEAIVDASNKLQNLIGIELEKINGKYAKIEVLEKEIERLRLVQADYNNNEFGYSALIAIRDERDRFKSIASEFPKLLNQISDLKKALDARNVADHAPCVKRFQESEAEVVRWRHSFDVVTTQKKAENDTLRKSIAEKDQLIAELKAQIEKMGKLSGSDE